jgi:hypothetical protein
MKTFSKALIALMLAVCTLSAAALTDGNILVADGSGIYEYTMHGTLVQKVASLTDIRDIAVDRNGVVYVYDGTFTPVLRIVDPARGVLDSLICPEWTTVNNGSYGGIAVFDTFVFVTDMKTASESDTGHGVIRFNVKKRSALRFAKLLDPIDLNIGRDSLLYVLSPGGSPEGRIVYRYDPVKLNLIDTMELTVILGWTGHRSVAAAENGDMFLADWDGDIQRVSQSGEVKKSIKTLGFYNDIDITRDGRLILGDDKWSNLLVYDSSLALSDSVKIPSSNGIFVTPIELGTPTGNQPRASRPAARLPSGGATDFLAQPCACYTLAGRLVGPAGIHLAGRQILLEKGMKRQDTRIVRNTTERVR